MFGSVHSVCHAMHLLLSLSLSASHLPHRAVINGCSSSSRPVFPILLRPSFGLLAIAVHAGTQNLQLRSELPEWHGDLLTVVLGTVMAPLELLRPM